jgi:hypothetical protein
MTHYVAHYMMHVFYRRQVDAAPVFRERLRIAAQDDAGAVAQAEIVFGTLLTRTPPATSFRLIKDDTQTIHDFAV